ncbi:glycosyltransferase family 2 protein [Clostridium tunisiense]|uniref:glycosyltransferase family 2 protein n=1 Tax=Clostridium tunisiense TaxID=219748 RepID=UPI0003683510|nr:glycosyltransferase [Clostridium tunisiense]
MLKITLITIQYNLQQIIAEGFYKQGCEAMYNHMEPMVSVVLITYNHGKYIKQCLDSILMQKVNFPFEIVIGNDCSTDDTEEILNSYCQKHETIIRVYNREENLGPTKNLYDVIKRGKGKYMILFEGDDYWTNDRKLQTMVDFLEENKEYSSVFHLVDQIDEDGITTDNYPNNTTIRNMKNHEIVDVCELFRLINKDNTKVVMHIQSILFKNFFIEDRIDEKHKEILTTAKMICDLQLKFLICSQGKMKYLPYSFSNYRYINIKNGLSFSSQKEELRHQDTLRVWEGINKFFNYKYSNEISNIVLKQKADYCIYPLTKLNLRQFQKNFSTLETCEKRFIIKEFFYKIFKKVGVFNND